MKISIAMLGLLMVAAHCEVAETKPPTPVVEKPEASCHTACENQRSLACDIGEPTSEGSSCEEVCEGSFDSGIPDLAWDVKELTLAIECE